MSNLIVTGGYGETEGGDGKGGTGVFVPLEYELTTQALSFTANTSITNFSLDTAPVEQQINIGVADSTFSQSTTNLTFNVEVIELC